jgi:hypothetical protein
MASKRSITLLGILTLTLGLLPLVELKAHNPSNMAFGYNFDDEIFQVRIFHPSENLTTHYIFEINVTLNGNFAVSGDYTSQPSESYIYSFGLAVNFGDLISVTARCTQGGIITVSSTLPQEPLSLPGFIGLFLILLIFPIIIHPFKIHNQRHSNHKI